MRHTVRVIGLVALIGLTACGEALRPDPAMVAAEKIPSEQLRAVSGSAAGVQRILTDSTHTVLMLRGVEYRYLGADGLALIRKAGGGPVIRGEWRVLPEVRGWQTICISDQPLPADLSRHDEACVDGSEFIGHAFELSRGDPANLRGR